MSRFFEYFLRFCLWHLAECEDRWRQIDRRRRVIGPWRRCWLKNMRISHGRELSTRPGLLVLLPGRLSIGERVALGHDAKIFNHGPIVIGDDFLAASGLILNSGTHDPETLVPSPRPITIGKRVWCGVRVTILAGVTIGDDVVIGAGAVVISDVESKTVVAGVPARRIRSLERSDPSTLWSRPLDGD